MSTLAEAIANIETVRNIKFDLMKRKTETPDNKYDDLYYSVVCLNQVLKTLNKINVTGNKDNENTS